MDDKQDLYQIIAIMTKKLGGKVEITRADILEVITAQATRSADGTITIELIKKEN